MDTDDRRRIDENMDVLRKNEESLKSSFSHQTHVIETMYKEITKATVQVEENMRKLNDWTKSIHNKTESWINFTTDVKKMIALDQDLNEAGLWITQMIRHIEEQQELYLRILLQETLTASQILQLVNPKYLWTQLEVHSQNLPPHVSFPRGPLGHIVPELIHVITTEHTISPQSRVRITLKVPLVRNTVYRTYRGIISPAVHNSTITLVDTDKNIMLLDPRTEMGYIITENEWQHCKKLGSSHICQLRTPLHNLKTAPECFAEVYFHNSITTCKIKITRTHRTIWISTPKPNEWIYIASEPIKAEITGANGTTLLTLDGTGVIVILPGTMLTTGQSILLYYVRERDNSTQITSPIEINITKFTPEELASITIPSLPPVFTPFLTRETLLREAVDIEDLKATQMNLNNLKYAPFKHIWITGPVALALIVVCAVLMIYRTLVSCCSNKADVMENESRFINRRSTPNPRPESSQLTSAISIV
uniref:Putative arac family transcriptional regulator n=1 Tax=Anopheles darlingi TaxID=43151 RepID=A0A2M4CXJ7_ANODA